MNDMHAVQGGDSYTPQGGELVPVRTPGASYLVRTEDADGSRLEFFRDDEKTGIRAAEPLMEYLTSLIQVNRYAIGPAVRGIWRWDEDDSLHEMRLSMDGISQEMDDFEDQQWGLEDPRDMHEDITFTVRIDRKGQQ